MNSFDATIMILVLLGAILLPMGAAWAGGYAMGHRRGYDAATKTWKRHALTQTAIWKQAYLKLWNTAYRGSATSVFLTSEERDALSDVGALTR